MKDFIFYFKIGWSHIMSLDATDHLFFIAVLAVIYSFADWKKVLILVTAFTVGHAITLFMSVLNLIRVNGDIVEFLIPCTILVTAVMNLFLQKRQRASHTIQYAIALGFGLIHGLGYANYIRMMLSADQQLVWGLFSFNLGLEAGQIVVVSLVLLTIWVSSKIHANAHLRWVSFVSAFVMLFALKLAIQRFPF
ncbi:MAG: HupE/UreJ family protein [bacterium]|jgi:hypothetical protein|nr:HupE/UreJ family protein [Chitinophagaceae bacterium]